MTTHLLSFTYPLHFGDWGGIIIKMLYCLFRLAPAILSITGFIIWRQRERKKRKLQMREKQFKPLQTQPTNSRTKETVEGTVV